MAKEIRQDQSFPRDIQQVAEEKVWLQNQQHSDEGSSLSSRGHKSLTTGVGDTKAFSAFESESNNEHNVHSNYRSSHDTLNESEEDGCEHMPTPKSEMMM